MDVKNKKVVILGIGVSGIESARFLRSQGAQVFVSEGRQTERTEASKALLEREGFEVEVGKHSESKIREADLIVISPGISPKTPVYQTVVSSGVPFYSEIEVASWFITQPLIAVTGTNGKTTVTTLIAKMLNEAGRMAITCGNIGNPLIGEINRIELKKLIPVVEVSSFQLMKAKNFNPAIGLVLNMEPDHLDWHADLEEYYEAKFNLFRNQTFQDYAVLNAKDAESLRRADKLSSHVVFFNRPGSEAQNPNLDACLAVSQILGLDREASLKALANFSGLEHRLEAVPSRDGRCYINDSKSTNVSSLVWALERMKEPVILVLGGKDKGGDFSTLTPLFRQKTKEIILIGETKEMFAKLLKETVSFSPASSLQEAVKLAREKSFEGDVILLSPGCASFDMFINYKDRGEQFKKLVSEIAIPCLKTVSAF
jgi:UDP-N-acetylmuramoylalanine--D-glutamate ligase